jgi:hypothetical protein
VVDGDCNSIRGHRSFFLQATDILALVKLYHLQLMLRRSGGPIRLPLWNCLPVGRYARTPVVNRQPPARLDLPHRIAINLCICNANREKYLQGRICDQVHRSKVPCVMVQAKMCRCKGD